jgi:dephospho-CoA kinase
MAKKKKSVIVGLTGPIAAGKNTVGKIFKRAGAMVIDGDAIGHQVIEPTSKAWREIIRAFGKTILLPNKYINRKKLGEIVFNNPLALKKLNRITHPYILKKIKGLVREGKRKGRKLIVINAAVLREIGLAPLADQILAVVASERKRLQRLIKGKKLSKLQSKIRIQAQRPVKNFIDLADEVIDNDGSINRLKDKVLKILSEL